MISFIDKTIHIRQATRQGYIEMPCDNKIVADLSFPTSKLRRGRVQDEGRICPTITTTGDYMCLKKLKYKFLRSEWKKLKIK